MKAKLKEREAFKEMEKNREIQHHFTADSGEVTHWGTLGNPSHVISLWYDQYGKEYLIVDHPNPMSKETYERLAVFFEEPSED